jgi:septum formation protein
MLIGKFFAKRAGFGSYPESMPRLVLASASPRRRELLAQAGYEFAVHPAHIPEDPLPDEEPIAYVVRLAREKAEAVFRELTGDHFEESAEGYSSRAKAHVLSDSVSAVRAEALTCQSCPDTGLSRLDGEALVVLGADTTVTLDGQILAKPADAGDAARMLRMLAGRTHRVITGVAVATELGTEVAAEVTAVRFLTLSDVEIAEYVATGEPLDKAGAYAIQGRAARWIPRVEGCYFNVVGLPLALVATLLESVKTAS